MAKGFIKKILLPKEEKFYPMFEDMAELIAKSAHQLAKIIDHYDPEKNETVYDSIKELEKKADTIAHGVFDALDTTFITPFDREDIQQLTSKMDDVLDDINSCSQQIKLYRPKTLPAQYNELCLILVRGCEQIRVAVLQLRYLKNPGKINDACVKINELENIADDIFHQLISDLFETETDPIELIKKKEILETLESTTDRIEDVSDTLKTIIIKSA